MSTAGADPRYPIGPFKAVLPVTSELRAAAIDAIAGLPDRMRRAVDALGPAQLDTPYRAGGWTVRQLVHHVADSHLNAYVRLKLALTEETPTILPYDQDRWAVLPDSTLPLEPSLVLLDGLHARWAAVLRALAPDRFARSFVHPELGGEVNIDLQVQQYAWHSHHHLAHVTELRRRKRW